MKRYLVLDDSRSWLHGRVMTGPDAKHVMANLRAMGVGLVGVRLREVDADGRRVEAA